jgi:hypothetical protein
LPSTIHVVQSPPRVCYCSVSCPTLLGPIHLFTGRVPRRARAIGVLGLFLAPRQGATLDPNFPLARSASSSRKQLLGIELRKGRSDARARCVNVNTTDATTGATEHTVTARSVRVQRLFVTTWACREQTGSHVSAMGETGTSPAKLSSPSERLLTCFWGDLSPCEFTFRVPSRDGAAAARWRLTPCRLLCRRQGWSR